MGKREEKIERIIRSTISILLKEGMGGLSLRKAADQADITLSNLQYYFPNMNELLKGTIKYYFNYCEKEAIKSFGSLKNHANGLNDLIAEVLDKHLIFDPSNEMCTMFREIWAVSTRNKEIHHIVMQYYRDYNKWLVEKISSLTHNPVAVTSLLLPYIEGYSIMGEALPLNREMVVEMLSRSVMGLSIE